MGQDECLADAEALHALGGMDTHQGNSQTGIHRTNLWKNGVEHSFKGRIPHAPKLPDDPRT